MKDRVTLETADGEALDAYFQFVAQDVSEDAAIRQSVERKRLDEGLPADERVFGVQSAAQGNVGFLWIKLIEQSERREIFLMDLVVYERCRRCGFASEALDLLEYLVKQLGHDQISLRVNDENLAARRLYEAAGYQQVSTRMSKALK